MFVALTLTNWGQAERLVSILLRRAAQRHNSSADTAADIAKTFLRHGNDRAAFTWAMTAAKHLDRHVRS